ncbi:MAG: aminodeoxychorismate synthase component I [Acidobacteria bacterium]|nr:aminodeoxychorismate synthase component I [Acidobacteriota bacterium]MBI3655424.1 aminodeoxychorismate synthase component I [Acidobacteriota bacterium]
MTIAVFESFDTERRGWSVCLRDPRALHTAHSPEQVEPVLRIAEEAGQRGDWAAVMISYEAASGLDTALRVHSPDEFPLAWVAVFDHPSAFPAEPSHGDYCVSPWRPMIGRAEYKAAIQKIHGYLARGETYQTNYTFPLQCRFEGDAWQWYRDLCAVQQAGYCAYMDLGPYRLLSLSPELFFQRAGNVITTRPMKGTLARGRWLEEDEEQARRLAACPKNRSENVMIVDLLRNDLGKISEPGTVRVAKLFEIERYEALLQMTSTIESLARPEVGLTDLLGALFPCGSVTGAPKIRTMEIIRELEPFPRRVYTGALGFVQPGGDAVFNVAIRTILLNTQTGDATFGVGGGITVDSTAEDEYEECVLKAAFLDHRRPEFRLLETILLEDGAYFLLDRHLARIRSSAKYFGFAWDEAPVRQALETIRAGHHHGCWKVRWLIARNGALTIEAHELKPTAESRCRVALAPYPIDSRDPLLFHKTTHRAVFEAAQKARPDCDDVIFWNERGEVTESSVANLVLVRDDGKWTPPRTAGLLAGTMRAELLARDVIRERVIHRDELRSAAELFLINSVRRWIQATLVD